MPRHLLLGLMLMALGTACVPDAVGAPAQPELAKPSDWSAQKRTRPRRAAPPTQIACTELGCHPVPPGCTPVPGRTWWGNYSGFDVVVCRRR